MNYLKTSLFIASLSIIAFSCDKEKYGAIRGKGDITTEDRGVTGFDAIHLKCSAEVSYTQDSSFSVQVFAQPNIMKVIDLDVIDKELIINYTKSIWNEKGVKIVVHSPQMRSMKISGSGDIISTGAVTSNQMYTHISGSGNIKIPTLNAASVEAKISGSGNIELLSGKTANSNYSISGSGNINSEFMKTTNNSSKISGSGDIRVNASEYMSISISGSGDVHYSGSPAMDIDISGSGKIRKI
jgi:hypothetical protein